MFHLFAFLIVNSLLEFGCSFLIFEMASKDLLEKFRSNWQNELQQQQQQQQQQHTAASGEGVGKCSLSKGNEEGSLAQATVSLSQQMQPDDMARESNLQLEIKAAELFAKGVEMEREGQLYQSVKFYRKAIAMVPDIETKIQQQYSLEKSEEGNLIDSEFVLSNENESAKSDEICDLETKFGNLFSISNAICEPIYDKQSTHISCLPMEMIDRIVSWVVGEDLDLRSLEALAGVSRGFYMKSRQPDLWKRACARIWGIKLGVLGMEYTSWREMCLTRPHPLYHGCYISKTSYFRSGENSFQDQSYQPWHFVTYFRYFRFFSNGQVLMLTTSDKPQTTVSFLKKNSKHPQIISGHFRLFDSNIKMLFKRSKKCRKNKNHQRAYRGTTDVMETIYQMEMTVKPNRTKAHTLLSWKSYCIISCYYNGSSTSNAIQVNDVNNFPSLVFSRVKSYTAQSNAPLP